MGIKRSRKRVQFSLDSALVEEFQRAARRESRSYSSELELAMKRHLKRGDKQRRPVQAATA